MRNSAKLRRMVRNFLIKVVLVGGLFGVIASGGFTWFPIWFGNYVWSGMHERMQLREHERTEAQKLEQLRAKRLELERERDSLLKARGNP